MTVRSFPMDWRLLCGQVSGGGSSPQQLRHGQPLTPVPQGPLMFSAPMGDASSGGMMMYAQQSQSMPNAAMLPTPSSMGPSGSRTQSPAMNSILQVSPPFLFPHAVVRAHMNNSQLCPSAVPSCSCFRGTQCQELSCPARQAQGSTLRKQPLATLSAIQTPAICDVCNATAATLPTGRGHPWT